MHDHEINEALDFPTFPPHGGDELIDDRDWLLESARAKSTTDLTYPSPVSICRMRTRLRVPVLGPQIPSAPSLRTARGSRLRFRKA